MLKEGKCATHLEAYPARVIWAQEATLYDNGLLALSPPLGSCRLFLCLCNGRGAPDVMLSSSHWWSINLSISMYHMPIIYLFLSSSMSTYLFMARSTSRCSFLALREKYFQSLLHEKMFHIPSIKLAAGEGPPSLVMEVVSRYPVFGGQRLPFLSH